MNAIKWPQPTWQKQTKAGSSRASGYATTPQAGPASQQAPSQQHSRTQRASSPHPPLKRKHGKSAGGPTGIQIGKTAKQLTYAVKNNKLTKITWEANMEKTAALLQEAEEALQTSKHMRTLAGALARQSLAEHKARQHAREQLAQAMRTASRDKPHLTPSGAQRAGTEEERQTTTCTTAEGETGIVSGGTCVPSTASAAKAPGAQTVARDGHTATTAKALAAYAAASAAHIAA
ncbi:hypothetical protein ERJ75_000294600 [Trypanosoma vivax]|nr:hypothetical protein ERJ75_000294600 [Trypanosoma vivax]